MNYWLFLGVPLLVLAMRKSLDGIERYVLTRWPDRCIHPLMHVTKYYDANGCLVTYHCPTCHYVEEETHPKDVH